MYVVRWEFQVRFGHLKEALQLLRQWEFDVGQRVGWRAQSLRVLQGALGESRSLVQLETRMESISDLESSWRDMAKNPMHSEAMKSLERYVVSGTDTWRAYEEVELFGND